MIYLVIIICLLVGSALAIVTLQNLSVDVQFTLFVWQTPSVPLGLLVVVAFLLGAVLLYVISILSAVRDYREVRMLRRRVKELEQSPVRMPSGPLLRPTSGPLRGTGPATTLPLPEAPSPPQS